VFLHFSPSHRLCTLHAEWLYKWCFRRENDIQHYFYEIYAKLTPLVIRVIIFSLCFEFQQEASFMRTTHAFEGRSSRTIMFVEIFAKFFIDPYECRYFGAISVSGVTLRNSVASGRRFTCRILAVNKHGCIVCSSSYTV